MVAVTQFIMELALFMTQIILGWNCFKLADLERRLDALEARNRADDEPYDKTKPSEPKAMK